MTQGNSFVEKNISKRILICEDDENIVEIVTYLLQEKDYEVIALTNCSDIKEVERANPGLILLDLWMPAMDGPTLAKHIKNNGNTKDVPIVVISANNDIEKISQRIGADGFLRKPFDIEELEDIVRKYMKN